MKNLNSSWKLLIYVGVFFLILVIGWEIYEVSTGGRSDFSLVVVDMPKTTLFTKNLEDHLSNDSLNVTQAPVSAPQ